MKKKEEEEIRGKAMFCSWCTVLFLATFYASAIVMNVVCL